jgi:carboxypeptidase T
MRSLFSVIIALLLAVCAHAQQRELYSRAKIYLDESHTINDLSALGLAVDHGEQKKNTYFISDFSASELERARKAGFKADILIQDVSKHYAEQNKKKEKKTTAVSCDNPAYEIPSHFHLGSYGGFFTYTEYLAILDSMQLLYPGLISVKQAVGTYTTIEGRPIYWIRISNNPGVDQPLKPQMLYTAVHHAREPGSLSAVIYYLWHVLEHYSTDPQIKAIVDNTELYFVPVVNPDGYLLNISTNPSGGGMWRKNMRDNLDGTQGVDLNRNYGYNWGYDDIGSSPITSSETYRGTAGFSEPETQAVKWFTDNHHFRFTMNYHTYHNDILYPWSYIPSFQTVDSDRFFRYGAFLTEYNDYRFGTCNQVLNYITNGDSNDWMYGNNTVHSKIFSFTPEIGVTDNGFYPPAEQIIPDCQNNLPANVNIASLLLPFAELQSTDQKIRTQASGYLHYNVQRLGDTGTFTVTALSLDSRLTVPATPKTYTGLTMLQQVTDSFSYSLLPTTANGALIKYVLRINNGLYSTDDTFEFYYGKWYADVSTSTNSLAAWINNGWGLSTTVYHTAPTAIQSSLSGSSNYPDNADLTISTATPIDLTHATHAYLYFYTKWITETDYDYAFVNAEVAGTGSWQPLCGKFTRPQRVTGKASYDGQMPNWVMEEMDLGNYLGQHVNIQFELQSDPAGNEKGFYFDDVRVLSVVDSQLGVQLVGNNTSVDVFPNPANDELRVICRGTFAEPIHATLIDCMGRVMMTITLSQLEQTINISSLPGGVYILRLLDGNTSLPAKKISIIR